MSNKSNEDQPDVTGDETVFEGPERIYAFADSVIDTDGENAEDEKKRAAELETWVVFTLAGETFAFPVTAAQEILRVSTITRVPHAPYTVRGIINMRGRVLPVVDLRIRLGLPEPELTAKSRILVTSMHQRTLGLLVDEVEQVVRLDRSQIAAAPSDVMTDQSEYIVGVYHLGKRLLILLDVERVLLIPDALQSAAGAGH